MMVMRGAPKADLARPGGARSSSAGSPATRVAPRRTPLQNSRGPRQQQHQGLHVTQATEGVDLSRLSELVVGIDEMEPEKRFSMERLAVALDVPLGTIKNMAFKRKALLTLTPDEVSSHIRTLAAVVDVPVDTARQMAVIQPGLLFDTEKQAETLKRGIQAICYELDAPKDEVVELILKNPSILHGRELRLSVADMAHLAMLREPKGRIVD